MSDTAILRDLFDLPEQIRKGDFVHKLGEGVENPKVTAELPAGLPRPETVKVMQVDWERAADRWDESQRFLADEFGR